ncbi:MAG: hypothetical protein LUD17_16080 [Bacteroidales bacterium]|nr:hypothetical protein [Bacteroidales bacterium]
MNKFFIFILISVLVITMVSANTDPRDEVIDGGWPELELTPKWLSVDANGGEYVLTTRSFWSVDKITINDTTYSTSWEERRRSFDTGKFSKKIKWLKVTKDSNRIILNVDTNYSHKKRTFGLRINEGNRDEYMRGEQKGAKYRQAPR